MILNFAYGGFGFTQPAAEAGGGGQAATVTGESALAVIGGSMFMNADSSALIVTMGLFAVSAEITAVATGSQHVIASPSVGAMLVVTDSGKQHALRGIILGS